MAALPGMDLPTARQVVTRRDSVAPGTVLPGLPEGMFMDTSRPGTTLTFHAAADDGHGARAEVEATVRFSQPGVVRDRRVPLYTILRWRDGASG